MEARKEVRLEGRRGVVGRERGGERDRVREGRVVIVVDFVAVCACRRSVVVVWAGSVANVSKVYDSGKR